MEDSTLPLGTNAGEVLSMFACVRNFVMTLPLQRLTVGLQCLFVNVTITTQTWSWVGFIRGLGWIGSVHCWVGLGYRKWIHDHVCYSYRRGTFVIERH